MRNRKKFYQLFLYALAVCSFVLLGAGFTMAVDALIRPSKSNITGQLAVQTDAPPATDSMLLGLGDSLTRGIGDSNGQGYFGLVKQKLHAKHNRLSAINLSVSGQTSTQLAEQVKKTRTKRLIQQARWVVMTIGGNDLFRSTDRLQQLNPKQIEQARIRYERNLRAILSDVKDANPHATVFLFGLYNPFGDVNIQGANEHVLKWNESITQIAQSFNGVVVIPTFDLFQLSPGQYLYRDHFHPNGEGYQRMADRLLQIISDQPGEGKNSQ
ncbi:lysophospholipase [Laceyella sacchari]|nr:lysophospholipase [Laceyella sacchari]